MTNVICVNANASRRLGCEEAWEAFIDDADSACRGWNLMFVSECDGYLDNRSVPNIRGCSIWR